MMFVSYARLREVPRLDANVEVNCATSNKQAGGRALSRWAMSHGRLCVDEMRQECSLRAAKGVRRVVRRGTYGGRRGIGRSGWVTALSPTAPSLFPASRRTPFATRRAGRLSPFGVVRSAFSFKSSQAGQLTNRATIDVAGIMIALFCCEDGVATLADGADRRVDGGVSVRAPRSSRAVAPATAIAATLVRMGAERITPARTAPTAPTSSVPS